MVTTGGTVSAFALLYVAGLALLRRQRAALLAGLLLASPAAAWAQASISITPSSLDFGEQAVGTVGDVHTITVTNTGTTVVQVSLIRNLDGNQDDFLGTQSCTDRSLSPLESCSISIRFAPLAAGPRSTTLFVVTLTAGVMASATLSGNGSAPATPAVSISPLSLSFGSQPIGTTSPAQSVTVTNTGSAPLSISSIGLAGSGAASFHITAGGESGAVAPGASRSIAVTFSPSSATEQSATLTVSSNAAGSPHTVALSGSGVLPSGPGIKVSPASLSFARLQIGSASSPKSVTITNPGGEPLEISGVTVTGDPDFLLDGGAGTVAPGGSLTLSITFIPSAPGERSATLSISHNAAGSPNTVSLRGTGASPPAPPPGTPVALITPAALSFGPVAVGASGDPLTLTVASTGTAPLVIRSATITGAQRADFTVLQDGVGTVAEGTSRTIGLRFAPTAAGSRAATLEISTNGSVSLHRVALSGTGVAVPPAPRGDWPVAMHDARQLGLAEMGFDPTILSPWSVPLGSRAVASPVVLGGVVYVDTEARCVCAIDTVTRTQRWNHLLPAPVRSAPAAAPDAIIVSAGGLFGLRPSDGAVLWQRPDIVATDGASPMLVNNVVYLSARAAGGAGAVLFAVKAATGENDWAAPVALPGGFEGRAAIAAYPEIGLLFVSLGPPAEAARAGAGPGAVMALRLSDGGAAWAAPAMFPTAAPAGGLSVGWVSSTPALAVPQPTVFVAAGARVTALNAASGATFWTRSLPEVALQGPPVLSSAAPRGSTLYVAGESGKVYALSSTNGANAPVSVPSPGSGLSGSLALADTYLYLPTAVGLVAADLQTGSVVWTHPGAIISGVAVAGGVPYAATADGRLLGFSR